MVVSGSRSLGEVRLRTCQVSRGGGVHRVGGKGRSIKHASVGHGAWGMGT
jgi:hypothetical protein